jgi:hypothetical protein
MSNTHIGEYMRDFAGNTGVPLSTVHSPVMEARGEKDYTWVTLFEKVHVLIRRGASLPIAFMGHIEPTTQVRPMYVHEEAHGVIDAYQKDTGTTPVVLKERQALDLLLAEHMVQMFVDIVSKRIES